jgi:DNA-binding MarR family transcriptional regulator
MIPSPHQCAAELLEVVPLLMNILRATVRSRHGPELSVPQFRTLAFLGRNHGATLSDVAGHHGLTLPAASKLVDGLVAAKLASRAASDLDRRRISLQLTDAGEEKYAAARRFARDFLARRIAGLNDAERAVISETMHILHGIFADGASNRCGVVREKAVSS